MSSPLSTAALPDAAAKDAAYYRRVLHELIDMGVDLARMIHGQAKADAGGDAGLAVAFDRIARTVRRTIGLARRLDEPVAGRDAARRRVAARRQIIRAVEDAIQDREPERREALEAELLERLDRPDLDDDIDHRPVDVIIAEICRDLGLTAVPGTRYWKRRTPGDVAALHARAAARPADPSALAGWAVTPPGIDAAGCGARRAAWPSGG